MPLIRYTKVPPPPEMGEKTYWQYLPRGTWRRVLFMLLALGAVLLLRSNGTQSIGNLFDTIGNGARKPRAGASAEPAAPVYHIRVTPPEGPPHPAGQP